MAESVEEGVGAEAPGASPTEQELTLLELLPGAMLGLAAEAGRRTFQLASAIKYHLDPAIDAAEGTRLVQVPLEALRSRMVGWNEAGSQVAARSRDATQEFLRRIVPQVVRAFLDLIDLNEVMEQVDLDAVIDRVDVARIVERLDVEAIVEQIDLNALAARIDIDAIAASIDLDRLVGRMDLTGIARKVIDELELGELIREATGTVTVEAVDALRVGGMSADQFVSRMVDRVLGRKGERALDLSGPSGNGGGPSVGAPPPAANSHDG